MVEQGGHDRRGEQNLDQQAEIADLGNRLNLALASQVQELRDYRSDFFGRLKAALGDMYKKVEHGLEQAIHLRFGLPAHLPETVEKTIKRADRMQSTRRRSGSR